VVIYAASERQVSFVPLRGTGLLLSALLFANEQALAFQWMPGPVRWQSTCHRLRVDRLDAHRRGLAQS
jgi:hypothetical protein